MVQVAVTDAVQVLGSLGAECCRLLLLKFVSALCGGFGFQVSLEEPLEL